jgi:hypothetical protein
METQTLGVVAAPLSGVEIVEDLAFCLVEGLKNNCDLQPNIAYQSFSAKIEIQLHLHALDTTQISKTVIVGEIDRAALEPSHTAEIEIPLTTAEESRERTGLSGPNLMMQDSAEPTLKKPMRYYTPRKR